jgi:Hemolysin-coregulated protein (uncharacterized)
MRRAFFGAGVIALAALAIAWKSAPATVSPGGARNVVGSAAIDGVGTVEVRGFSAGVSQGTAAGTGAGAGKAKFEPYTIVKPMDSTSAQLFSRTVAGQHIASVAISISAAKGAVVYKLSDCFVSAFRPSATGAAGDAPYEEVSFTCAKVEFSAKA